MNAKIGTRHKKLCEKGKAQPDATTRKGGKDSGKKQKSPKQKKKDKLAIKRKPTKPCAFETLKIYCEHCKPAAKPKKTKKGKKAPPGRRVGGYEYRGGKMAPNFAVTADPEKGEIVTVEMAGSHGHCAHKYHGRVVVFLTDKEVIRGGNKVSFKAIAPSVGQSANARRSGKKPPSTVGQWLAAYSKANFHHAYYVVAAYSCGHPRKKGTPVYSVGVIGVRAYPNDQYKLSVTCRFGEKKGRARAGEAHGGRLITKDNQSDNDANRGLVSYKLTRTRGGTSHELERPAAPLARVNRYAARFKKIEGVAKRVFRNVPKIGWSFDWEVAWFEGSIEAAWGYREYPEKALSPANVGVYWWWMLKAEMKLFKGKIEVHFGIILPILEVTVFGKLEGDIFARFEIEKKPLPGFGYSHASATASLGGKVEMSLGIRGAIGTAVSIDGLVKSGIEVAGRIVERVGTHAAILFDIKWLGAEGTITVVTWWGRRKRQYKKKFFNGSTLGVWRLPDGVPIAHG